MKSLFFPLFLFLSLPIFSQVQSEKHLRRFLQTAPSPAESIPYGNNSKAGHYVSAGDAKMYYEVYGKGQPIVLLHGGIFGSTYEMATFIDSLSGNYQVIAISTRGHGRSDIGNDPLTYEQKANDVYAVIKAVTNDSVIVLGFSDGSYTGFKLASMYPGRVKKLIAIGASELYPGVRSFSFDAKQAVAMDSAYWKQQFTLMPEPDRLQEWFTRMGEFYSHLTMGKELFETIKCPVLLMAGDRDLSNSVQHAVNTWQMIPNCQLSIIPNSTHTVFLENFSAVWAGIVPFLKQ